MPTLQRLTCVNGSFTAHVLEAKLRAEGIDCELRGAIDSPYALTVGDLSRVDLYVPADQLDDAELVLLAGEVDAALAAPSHWAGSPRVRWLRWVATLLLVAAVVGPCATYVNLP